MNTTFMNLTRGNALAVHVGVDQTSTRGEDYQFGADYSYIELALKNPTKLTAGEFVTLFPVTAVAPRKCKLLIVPNAALAVRGTLSYQSIIEPAEGERLGFGFKAEVDIDLSVLGWLCRVYAIYG